MSFVPYAATLINNRAQTLQEFKGAIEGIRSSIFSRNGRNFSKKLADQKWRDEQIADLFQKVQSGEPFFVLTDHPLLKKLVKRNGKNEAHMEFIKAHLVPCFLDLIKVEPHEKIVEWAASLNALLIDEDQLMHHSAQSARMPPSSYEKLLKETKEIDAEILKRLESRFFTQEDAIMIANIVQRGHQNYHVLASDYFAVLSFLKNIKAKHEKDALISYLQGAPYSYPHLVDRNALAGILAISADLRAFCSENPQNTESFSAIIEEIQNIGEPHKWQYCNYYAFKYLRVNRLNNTKP